MDQNSQSNTPKLLDAVALLDDRPADGLSRGQVGTVVEFSDDGSMLVEFSDDNGRAYAMIRCSPSELLTLHYEPQAA